MRDSWEVRFEWIQSVLQWVALVVGVGISFIAIGITPETVAASLGVAAYTIAMQAIPSRSKNSPLVGSLLSLLGVATSLFAIGLTGGLDSAFLLCLAVPVFFASALHGTTLGSITAIAAIVGLVGVAAGTGSDALSSTLPLMVAFYALISITFSQARRILIEEPEEEPGAAQFRRLETAHQLLDELTNLASSSELNPITIGRATLRDLAASVPYSAGWIAIADGSDFIPVATRGQPGLPGDATTLTITLHKEPLGLLKLWPLPNGSLDPYRAEIRRSMGSVALALDNVLLLQTIAHRAVREERMRLARELHDDIGPSLVSVGLGLDVAILSADMDDDMRSHLTSLRETVGVLVAEVRSASADLRSMETGSLLQHATALAADVSADGPSIVIDLDEAEVPRRRDATELASIMTEAVRNAVEHSGASVVLIEGSVRRDRGEFRVSDDGCGIDPTQDMSQRYGLVGMRERAGKIGARFSVSSEASVGTSISVSWGSK